MSHVRLKQRAREETGLGGPELPQGAVWGTPHPGTLGSRSSPGRCVPGQPSPHLLASSSSPFPPSAVGGTSQAHWPSSVSPRMDSRSISSMLLPSEDSSLSKPNLRISLNLNGENKMVRSVPMATHTAYQGPAEWLQATGHSPSLVVTCLLSPGNQQGHFVDR